MIGEIARIRVDGEVLDVVASAVSSVEVSEDVDSATAFRIRLDLTLDRAGAWPHLDRPAFAPWHRIRVEAGFPPDVQTLVDGYLTHLDARLDPTGSGTLELSGMDRSVALDVEDRQRIWPDRTDTEIARQIFQDAGLTPVTDPTDGTADAKVAVTAQSGTDIRFLRRLARRNGFECYVRGDVGYFRAPNLREPPQKVLALAFGPATNLAEARIRVDGTAPARVDARQINPFSAQVEIATRDQGPSFRLGRDGVAAFPEPGNAGRRVLRDRPAPSTAAMGARLKGAYAPSTWFVTLNGVVDARLYQAVLRCNRLVTVKGIGERHSGLYYVTRVEHVLSPDGYTQRFTAHRDGLGLTGREQFADATATAAGSGAGPKGGR